MCLEGKTGGKGFSLRDSEKVFALLTPRIRLIPTFLCLSPVCCFSAWHVDVRLRYERALFVLKTLFCQNRRGELLGCPDFLRKVQPSCGHEGAREAEQQQALTLTS